MQWPTEKDVKDVKMDSNGQQKMSNGQTMQWPTDKDVKDVIRTQWTDNAMANR